MSAHENIETTEHRHTRSLLSPWLSPGCPPDIAEVGNGRAMTTKEVVKATFNASQPVYCTTLAAGLKLLRHSLMVRPDQVHEWPHSTLPKFPSLGREKHTERRT